jgi:glutaminase
MSDDCKHDKQPGPVRDACPGDPPLIGYLTDLHARVKPLRDGVVASYIPELARVNPELFSIAVVTTDGRMTCVGDHEHLFTMQSISKPFVYGLALEKHGREMVNSRIGVEPTGDAFNSLIRLDETSKRPHNPMVNAGAIAVADLIHGVDSTDRLRQVLRMFKRYCGREPNVDMPVFVSEKTAGHRNRAIAHLMLNFGLISPKIDESLDLYCQQCAVLVNCRDLAVMAATLANHGVNPVTGERAIDQRYVRDLLSVMLSCGMYDGSGEWAYHVGIPAKSGVSGGVIGVIPGRMGVAVFSPPLDPRGNSVRGLAVFQQMSQDLGLHLLDSARPNDAIVP